VEDSGMTTRGDDFIPTRESLLSRLKRWDDCESWQKFFDIYWRLIYGTARLAGLTDAEAQDIVQETVISVAKNIEGFRYDPAVCSFKTWMLNVTRWRIINQLKRRRRDGAAALEQRDGSAAGQLAEPATFDLEAIWDAEWERGLLNAALERVKRQVSLEHFQIFDLYCLENWPVQKVAQTLGVSAAKVYLAKHRVGRLLKREIALLGRGELPRGR
jgi:RNA polymerase sigma-70 factor (ECF subfamily)